MSTLLQFLRELIDRADTGDTLATTGVIVLYVSICYTGLSLLVLVVSCLVRLGAAILASPPAQWLWRHIDVAVGRIVHWLLTPRFRTLYRLAKLEHASRGSYQFLLGPKRTDNTILDSRVVAMLTFGAFSWTSAMVSLALLRVATGIELPPSYAGIVIASVMVISLTVPGIDSYRAADGTTWSRFRPLRALWRTSYLMGSFAAVGLLGMIIFADYRPTRFDGIDEMLQVGVMATQAILWTLIPIAATLRVILLVMRFTARRAQAHAL
ncbi:MAG TPA: hypothetical protein VF597_04065 [Candidatus Saccharimonadales bacterium]|jgi:hypothetical protein